MLTQYCLRGRTSWARVPVAGLFFFTLLFCHVYLPEIPDVCHVCGGFERALEYCWFCVGVSFGREKV